MVRLMLTDGNGPLYAHLDLTYKCNWKCNFCAYGGYESEFPYRKEHLFEIVRLLKAGGVKEITLFRGEPFLYPNAIEIAKYIVDSGLRLKFATNGTMLTHQGVKELSQIAYTGSISLHGFPKTHDNIVGVPEAYKRARKPLELFCKHGLGIGVCSTLTRKNSEEFVYFAATILQELPIRHFVTDIFTPVRGYPVDLLPRKSTLIRVLGGIVELKDRFPDRFVEVGGGLRYCIAKGPLEPLRKESLAGTLECTVGVDGTVHVCASGEQALGNLFSEPLRLIWHSSSRIKAFRSLAWVPQACSNCNVLTEWLRGCEEEPKNVELLNKHYGLAALE